MEIFPHAHVDRFEKIAVGDLFVYLHKDGACYAIKTEPQSNGDGSCLVPLGPNFPDDFNEAFFMQWARATVLTVGANYTVLLPTDPNAWFSQGDTRRPVCLAISGESAFICVNGGISPQHHRPCFVELRTGKIIENRLPLSALYTNSWEIVISHKNLPARSILRYPLETTEGDLSGKA